MDEQEKATLCRIREALESRLGLSDAEEQAARLAQWGGVQVRTARRWVAGQSFPLRWPDLLATIQHELNLSPICLWGGKELMSFDLESLDFAGRLAWMAEYLTPDERARFRRELVRYANQGGAVLPHGFVQLVHVARARGFRPV